MKYLVLSRSKDVFLMLPPEMRVEILEGTIAFIEKYRKAGKCKDIYMDADLNRSISIWETDSEEEATKFITENPSSPFSDTDIRPVVGWDIAVKAFAEVIQRLTKK